MHSCQAKHDGRSSVCNICGVEQVRCVSYFLQESYCALFLAGSVVADDGGIGLAFATPGKRTTIHIPVTQ